MPMTDDERREKSRARSRAYYEANREKVDAYRAARREEIKAARRAYYEKNREAILAKDRARSAANPKKVAARMRSYYERNRDKRIAYSRAYHEANAEKRAEYARDYRQANLEKAREKGRLYHEKNKEKRNAASLAFGPEYREANREAIRAKNRAYYEANREKRRAYNRAYREANREKLAARQLERQRAAGVQPRVAMPPEEKRARAVARYRAPIPPNIRWDVLKGGRCEICGWGKADGVKLHIDHIVPVSKGGTSDRHNLQALCAPCNLGKSDHYDPASTEVPSPPSLTLHKSSTHQVPDHFVDVNKVVQAFYDSTTPV